MGCKEKENVIQREERKADTVGGGEDRQMQVTHRNRMLLIRQRKYINFLLRRSTQPKESEPLNKI